MARLNPKRRRMAKQAALFTSIVNDHGPSHDDSAKLQQGKVQCAMERPSRNYAGMAIPRHLTFDTAKGRSPASKPNKREGHVDTLRHKAQVLLLAKKNREG